LKIHGKDIGVINKSIGKEDSASKKKNNYSRSVWVGI
jgi:hypothetical protein